MNKRIANKQFRSGYRRGWAVVLLVFTVQTTLANPLGPSVVNGQASFATAGNTLTVTNTPGTIINWQGFSIGANEVTRFAQQSATSSVLNRVISNNPSSILGTLQSNGRVFLVNPNGIVFGQGATVDVAGMVASTLNLSNADFLAGRYNFAETAGAQNISNAGNLGAQAGGQIYLIAPNVENSGIINAPNGEILLAAGHSVELVNSIEPNLRVNITAPAGDATNIGKLIAESGSLGLFGTVVRNSGTVSADSATRQGGKIVFKAAQSTEISGAVSATGTTGGTIQALGNQVGVMGGATVSANGTQGGGTVLIGGDAHGANPDVQNAQATYVAPAATISSDASGTGDGGKVVVWADNTTQFNGSISAQGGANGGNGGWVEVSGKKWLGYAGLVNTSAAKGATGSLLLDPMNITISTAADSGSMAWTSGTLTFSDPSTGLSTSNLNVTTLTNQLALTNVTVDTSVGGIGGTLGDITVSNPVVWATANTLTLSASNNIAIDAALTGANGGIVLNAPAGTISNSVGAPVAAVISANTLQVNSSGAASFAALNQVNTLAANVTAGAFAFENALPAGLTIGTVGAMNGVSASGAITIRQNTSGGIVVEQNVASSAGDVMLGIASGAGGILTQAIVSGLNTQVYTSGGNIAVNAGLTAATGTATLDAGSGSGTGSITTGGAGQINANTIGLQTTFNSTGAIGTLGAPLKTASIGGGNAAISMGVDGVGPSAVYINHTGDATLNNVTLTIGAATPVNIYASSNLTATSINTGSANMSLSAGTGGKQLTIPVGATLSGANIDLIADRLDIQSNLQTPSSINTGAGMLWLHPVTAGWNIDLGSTTNIAVNTLELSPAELDTLVGSGTLRIGHSASGNIFLSGPVAPAGFSTGVLSLWSGGTVTQATVADIITANKLAIQANGDVLLDTAPNVVSNLAATVNGSASDFSFKNAAVLNVAAGIDGVSGISMPGFVSPNGVIALTSTGALTQSAGALLAGSSVYAEGTSVILTGANPTGVIAGKATGNGTGDIFSYTSSNGIMVTTVNGFAGIQTGSPPDTFSVVLNAGNAGISQNAPIFAGASGISLNTAGSSTINSSMSASTINLQSTGGITLGAASSLTAGGVATIVLNAGTGSFVNNSSAGAAALSAPASRWLVYASSPVNVTKGGLTSDFRQYSTAYGGNINSPTGNGFIYASAPGVLSVDTTLVSGAASNAYGSAPTAVFGYAFGNPTIADNEDLLLIAGTPIFTPSLTSTTPAGGYTVSYLSGLTSVAGYTFTPGAGFAYTVDPAVIFITASLTGTASKTYDGNTSATLAPGNFLLSGFVNADSATVTQTAGTYASANAGSGIMVSTTLAPSDFVPVGATNLANYILPTSVSGLIGTITPLTVNLALTGKKVYDGTPTFSTAQLAISNAISGDLVSLSAGTASTADKNVGVGKPFASFFGLALAGASAGNYTLAGASGTGTITARPLSTWSGMGGNSLWSNPANWDALPDGSNVLAVSIPAGGSVTFDGAVTLPTLASAGNMLLNGNNIDVGSYTQTGGSLTGTGNLNVNDNFSQTGGTITLTGASTANINQSGGNLNIANLSAPVANLTASTGAITQVGPIIVAALATQSATGTTLTDIGNQIVNFNAGNSASGNIALTNTGALTITGINNNGGDILVDNIGGVSTTGAVSASGAVSITAHSPITIGSGGINAGGKITLIAGTPESPVASDIITLNGAISGSSIILAAHSVTGTTPAPAGAVLEIYKEPATPSIIDNMVSNIVLIPPAPEALVQTPAADATADDEKKKGDKVAAQDVAASAAEPAPAVASLPVCK